MSVLQQTETKSARVYIHDAQDEPKQHISPLAIPGSEFTSPKTPEQSKLLITDGTDNQSTALIPMTPSDETIEKVEGIPDLSEDLFSEIPEDVKPVRPLLTYKKLAAMRKAFVFFARPKPLDETTGELSQMMKEFFRKR